MLDDQYKDSPARSETVSDRRVDRWARRTLSFFNKSWEVTSRLHVRTWHALFILAFVSGTVLVFFMSFSSDIEPLRNSSLAQTTVVPPPPPPPLPTFPTPEVTLSANPTSIATGDSSRLSWSSTNTVSCTASGAWTGTKTLSGSESVTSEQTATYTLICAGSFGGSATRSVTVTVTPPADTTPPTVSITSPQDGASYTSAQTVSIAASASDSGGIARVEFFDGSTLKGTDTSSPYSYAWAITTSDNGTHRFTAKAYDVAGNPQTSSAVNLTVNISSGSSDTTNPTVSLTAPATGTVVVPGATVAMTAEASDNVGVTRVEFLVNGAVRCTDTASPYTCSWKTPKANGKTYTLQARAADAAGNTGTSASASITATK